jgi:hypothetical protein
LKIALPVSEAEDRAVSASRAMAGQLGAPAAHKASKQEVSRYQPTCLAVPQTQAGGYPVSANRPGCTANLGRRSTGVSQHAWLYRKLKQVVLEQSFAIVVEA